MTLPGRPYPRGRLHPHTLILREMYDIWAEMGFQVYRARDVETDEYNFELLNIPQHHPARDMWDTFYTTTPGVILRTHTSPGQIHAMREYCPQPIRVILPGMCYRYEQISASKGIQFLQMEGLAVGKSIRMGDLLGTITEFNRRIFGPIEGRAFALPTSRSRNRAWKLMSAVPIAAAPDAACANTQAGWRLQARAWSIPRC